MFTQRTETAGKFIFCCFIIVMTSGCVSGWKTLNQGLDRLMGQSEDIVFNVLGYPDGQQAFDTQSIMYIWNTSRLAIYQTTTYQNVSGYVGNTYYTASIPVNQTEVVNYNCTIKLMMREGKVSGYDYSGNLGGCRTYIKRFRRYLKAIQKERAKQQEYTESWQGFKNKLDKQQDTR